MQQAEELLVDVNAIKLINIKDSNPKISQEYLSFKGKDDIKSRLLKIDLLLEYKLICEENLNIRFEKVVISDLVRRMHNVLLLIKVYKKLYKYRSQLSKLLECRYQYHVITNIDNFGKTSIIENELLNVESFYYKFNKLIPKMTTMEEFKIFIEEDPLKYVFPITNKKYTPIFKF